MSQSETPVGSMITRTPGWTRFLLVALIIHIPLFIYPVLRIGDWLQLGFLPTILALLLLVPGQIVSRVFLRRKREGWAGWYKKAADFWLGLSPMLLMTLLL
ncbi:MAG: hypothetical protein OEZ23_03525, partial [Gammaproteobacteria bacterium]|nr:hypothetical protein [Gammaproteobacteria bacterium]